MDHTQLNTQTPVRRQLACAKTYDVVFNSPVSKLVAYSLLLTVSTKAKYPTCQPVHQLWSKVLNALEIPESP